MVFQAQATDIDALERVLHLLCHGDFDHATAPTHDLTRVIHLAQLALQYLVFVQNQLATENAALRTEDHGQRTMQLRVAELKQRLALTQHELKRYRKTTKTYEVRSRTTEPCFERHSYLPASVPGKRGVDPGGKPTGGRCCSAPGCTAVPRHLAAHPNAAGAAG